MAWASVEEALTVGYGIERAFVCPGGHSNNAHASVNSLTGWWYCYSCHASGHVDMDRMEIDPASVQRYIEQVQAQMNPVHDVYPQTYLNLYDATGPGPYWLSRFGLDVCRYHRLGQAPDGSYATIPMRDNLGRVLGVIRRDLTGNDKIKYRYPFNLQVTSFLYNYHQANGDVLILTEGPSDVVACDEAGYEGAMACYGSSLAKPQAQLIRRYYPSRVLVAFDQDDSGDLGYARVQAKLGEDFPVERLHWDTYKDLASIPLQERREMLRKVTTRKYPIRVVMS